jgi:hypothetical protein
MQVRPTSTLKGLEERIIRLSVKEMLQRSFHVDNTRWKVIDKKQQLDKPHPRILAT